MKVLVFGNSGSGKSTYARALAAREGVPYLDLDSIVWEPGQIAVQRSPESVAGSLRSFIDLHPAWVIEGCYRQHKYASLEAQNAMLSQLQEWVADYYQRKDSWSFRAHREIFDAFTGPKVEYRELGAYQEMR